MKHTNNGACQRCDQIFKRYPGFHAGLWAWFTAFQKVNPEAHISCAGRGRDDQEAAKIRGASRASFGESAHNYNAAIDIFEMKDDLAQIYEKDWFIKTVRPVISKAPWLKWYGRTVGTVEQDEFFELPHIEVADWREFAKQKNLTLIGVTE